MYEEGCSDPDEAQTNAYNMIRQCSDVNRARHNLADPTVPFLERIPYLCGGENSDGTLYGRLLDKMLTLDSCIERLLILPRSGSVGRILDEDVKLEVRAVDESRGTLHYNFVEDELIQQALSAGYPIKYDEFVNKIKPLKDPTGHHVIRRDRAPLHFHAECALFAHIDTTRFPTFNYFGTSKLCCIGCWQFFQAYNSLELSPPIPKYYVRGSHSRQYPWVAPPPGTMIHRNETLRAMEPLAKNFFTGLLPKAFYVK